MIPSEPEPDAPDSEQRVFRAFERDLPDDWTVFHSRRLVLPATPGHAAVEKEVDFIVLDPRRGFLGLEVKGGSKIEIEDGGWFSTNRRGRFEIKNPAKQAQDAVHALDRFLGAQAWFRANRAARLPFGWGVVLPNPRVTRDLGPGLPRSFLLDEADLESPRDALDRVFEQNGLRGAALDGAAVRALVAALAPRLKMVRTLAHRFREDAEVLERMTEEQSQIMDMLSDHPRIAIAGSAGTGKTLLAVEWARRLTEEGQRVLLLCFNRPLADFLAGSADGWDVNNFHGVCHDLAERAGLRFEVPETGDARAFWDEDAPLLLLDALDHLPDERYDAIIVDEGQDFRADWWRAIEELLREPRLGRLVVFFDENQDLYGGGPAKELDVAPTRLSYNCRNTAGIARFVAQVIGIEPRVKPGMPEGDGVELIECADEKESVDAVRKALHRLVREQDVEPQQIVILSTRSGERSPVWRASPLGSFSLVALDAELRGDQVRMGSLHRFKGLESDVIILTDVEPGAPTSSPTHVYVGSSRARHKLIVVQVGGNRRSEELEESTRAR